MKMLRYFISVYSSLYTFEFENKMTQLVRDSKYKNMYEFEEAKMNKRITNFTKMFPKHILLYSNNPDIPFIIS